MKNFPDILFATVPKSDLNELTDCETGSIIAAHFDMCQKRKQGVPLIRIGRTICDNPGDERTTVEIVCNDHAFLVDSVVAEINKHNLLIDFMIHPYIYTMSDNKGRFISASNKEDENAKRQSHIHIRLQRLIPRSLEKKLKEGLLSVIDDVKLATTEWHEMRFKVLECHNNLNLIAETLNTRKNDFREYAAFLDYMYDHNFTLLGYRYFKKSGTKKAQYKDQPKESLGLLHRSRKEDFLKEYTDYFPNFFNDLEKKKKPLHVFKVNRDSPVHRRVPIDAITIEDINKDGTIEGFHLFIGLFTSVTYSRSVNDIPYLRHKIKKVIQKADFPAGSHDDKTIRHVLEKYPRDELFQIETAQLHKNALSILRLQERQRISLFIRPYIFGSAVACMIYIPRERFDTRMRLRFQRILENELGGETKAFYITLDDSIFVRVILLIEHDKKRSKKIDEERLEKVLQQAGRAWDDLLEEVLNVTYGTSAEYFAETYCGAFPISYRESYEPDNALKDIEKIETLITTEALQLDLYRPKDIEATQLRLKIYVPEKPIVLSDILPILENMGLQVISELPHKVNLQHEKQGTKIWIHDFLLETENEESVALLQDVKDKFEVAFAQIWAGNMVNDSLNQLILQAKMAWREVDILRTYAHYLKQLNYPFSRRYIAETLTSHTKIARLMVDLFRARHDPAMEKQRIAYAENNLISIMEELNQVVSLDQDRILRSLLSVIQATLRTNFYQANEDGTPKEYLSIKLNSAEIPDMPDPKPYREIFVYSPRIEGIHLRGGPIARGGLRWSDRLEDYRTEVLGLMKAQMVKNALIVPVGAKGGFVMKNPPKKGGREAFLEEGIRCYKTFICGLLDITDNRKGHRIIPPKDVVRHDDNDPYLVVAADKGTATFSDIANSISKDYGFWMGDAFASGGSAGYDHKVMGITAKGAWESVKRHFSELNHDTQTQEFDVVGVGDMGGDVFGNGMLLSQKIRLIGAFNHLHIFCDPDPDPQTTWKERKRLFDAVKGWDAYNTKLLSKGGKIYSRNVKSLELTPEIQKKFGIDKSHVSPPELIRAMLKAKTDLLWFGGIGTYIKSSTETDLDVGDKTNDSLRIDASNIQAKVIGEGANLGITQLGRIEFSDKGGRINADFIDNSGGVNSSDNEVNIKILLQSVMEKKSSKMTVKSRNKLLEDMTDDIATHVLYDNASQAEAISLMEFDAAQNIIAHADLITEFEQEIGLDRELEGLPDAERIEMRQKAGKGLTRPELSVLQAYTKLNLTDDLLKTKIPDLPIVHTWLYGYFPDVLQKKYGPFIESHQLQREIIAMRMANNIVNRMGPTFIKSQMLKTGASVEHIVRSYLSVRHAFGLSKLWKEINSDKFSALTFVRLRALKQVSIFARRGTSWYVNNPQFNMDMQKIRDALKPGVAILDKDLLKFLPAKLQRDVLAQKKSYTSEGFPAKLSETLALMPVMNSVFDLIRIANQQKNIDLLPRITRLYFVIGEIFALDWLHEKSMHMKADGKWEKEARDHLISELYRLQAALTDKLSKKSDIASMSYQKIDADYLKEWMEKNMPDALYAANRIRTFRKEGNFDFSILTLAEQGLSRLV